MSVGGHRRSPYLLTGSMCLAMLCPWQVSAQDAERGGLAVDLTFSQQLRREDSETFSRSQFDLGLSSVTRSQFFEVDLGGAFDAILSGDSDTELDEPFLRLNYGIENQNTLLSFNFNFRQDEVRSSVLTDTVSDTGLIVEDVDRTDIGGGVRLEFGRVSPVGGLIEVSQSETRFSGGSASLLDIERRRANARLTFDISPRLQTRATTSYDDTDREGGRQTETFSLGVGATLGITPTLEASVDLGYTTIQESGIGALPDQDGAFLNLALLETRPNGSISAVLSSVVNQNGRRVDGNLQRDFVLPNGAFQASIGFSADDDDNVEPIYQLAYQQALPRGSFAVSFNQQFSFSNAGDDVLNSRLNMDYSQRLTPRSGFSVGLSFLDTDFSGLGNDAEQFDLRFSYDHALTERWSLIGGYIHSRRRDDGGTDISDDEIFVGLETTIGWRP